MCVYIYIHGIILCVEEKEQKTRRKYAIAYVFLKYVFISSFLSYIKYKLKYWFFFFSSFHFVFLSPFVVVFLLQIYNKNKIYIRKRAHKEKHFLVIINQLYIFFTYRKKNYGAFIKTSKKYNSSSQVVCFVKFFFRA